MMHPVRTLTLAEFGLYRAHLLRLSAEDRRLRFGYAIDDRAVRTHVAGLAPGRDAILASFSDDLAVVGAVHIARCNGDVTEFAFSVEAPFRGRRIGTSLFERAILFARNRRARTAYLYCLAENRAMRRLARHVDMKIATRCGDSEGKLLLALPTPMTFAREAVSEHAALYDYTLKANRRAVRALSEGLRPAA